ncbi:unnamed protein product [Lepeophtheirus salmonis]|uniref:(salmon louse) hypothetical protein n=1 Tax=Lepeophtheirus salmonis TaxID=72036 RepID=A0A7R8H1S2_LEPSM|nr:unnamed protein product [Lepeophtheirus salmonis]CAF2798871.1 unnamed protein product [Lepeophtheirus salmonis]
MSSRETLNSMSKYPEKIIDKHLKSNTLAKTIGSEKKFKSKKSKGKWIEILVNSCKPKVSRMYQSEKRNNLLMERNDSGFSEGKRSSSSSSLSRRLSDESIGRRTRRGNQPIVSRGAELLRLGNQKYAENKKRRSQIKSSKNSTESFSFPFNDLRTARRTAFEKEMRKSFENEEVIQCSQILAMLIEFQIEAINNGDDVSMSALAEITISSLLKHLQSTGQIKANLVNLVADNFLVDPLSISRRKTSLKMPKRLRDHKLQVLYRMELHWLLPSADDQEKFENEILIHLRQISIWGSPEDMVTFLNEVLTPVYIDRQPELLCSLYDELNQPKADALRGIFSPSAKSDCSSVAPSSVMSQASNASQNSSKNPSLRSHNNKSVARIKKLRRPHSFDMGQRRQISQPHLKTTARVLAKNPTCNIKDKVGPSVTASPSSKGRSGLHRVKRNLSFDGLGRSPMKKPSTPRKKHETPKKKVTGTPKRMTPNKTHRIYAPETPKNKTRRKSDGLITIEESPDIDSIKACKTTPRRMRASLNLYKKTSFYSGDVSRNLMKAEENVNAFKIQGTSSQSQPFLDESSCDNTAGYLFQHIIRKRNRPDDEDDNSRKKIRKIDDDHRFLSDPSSSPMKTPKKMTFKTPVKESPSPSKRVQFNMQHQPPTPSRGTPAKSILKTPSKEPQTPTNRLNSPLVHSSAAHSPSKPRLLVPIRQCSSTSTKKKIDFEETKSDYSGQPLEIEIPDSDLDKIVLKSKVSMFEPESSSCKDFAGDEKEISSSNNPFLNEDSLENESTEYPSSTNNVISNDTTPLKNACTSSKICDTDVDSRIIDTNIKNNIESAVIDNSDTNVLRPIQLENIHEDLSVLETEPIDDNGPIKRTNRSRRATQRLGIDDVPIIGTPSPLRKATKLTSKGSSTTEIRRKTSRARSFTQRFGIDDITLDEAKVNVDDPVDSIVDDLGDKNELEIEPSSISPVKHWSITNIIESPQGEIKLKINRTPKSTFISQRISRSLVSEIGVSPERLRRLLTHTPSPKKKPFNKRRSFESKIFSLKFHEPHSTNDFSHIR